MQFQIFKGLNKKRTKVAALVQKGVNHHNVTTMDKMTMAQSKIF